MVTGKPGDGKSLYATMLILQDLVAGNVFVVTNVPLIPDKVHAYVVAKRKELGDDRAFDFDASCKVLQDDQVMHFWQHRKDIVLPPSPDFDAGDDAKKRLQRQEFMAAMKQIFAQLQGEVMPVHYYLDEAHNYFSSREWTMTGRALLYYLSQHRHLHDNIFAITQVVDNVEKQMRTLASELHRVRNNLRRSMGPFKLRGVFKISKFYGCPPDSNQTVEPYSVEEMELQPDKVAGCYKTVGALGVQTKPEAIKNNGKLPWWTVWVAGGILVCLLGAAFTLLPVLGGRAVGAAVGSSLPTSKSGTLKTELKDAEGKLVDNGEAVTLQELAVPAAAPVSKYEALDTDVYIAGYSVRANGSIIVELTDGRRLYATDGIEKITPGRVYIDGKAYGFKPKQTVLLPLPTAGVAVPTDGVSRLPSLSKTTQPEQIVPIDLEP